ncbi:cyclic nucleotide-gated ion channel [Insolitispirillum peregrinum]|uniref:Voltage-gated potassium channel n=1 Tax=Insolitispirillum peregrinum TaxID=80876 RepID=A0A1N7NQN0_9PROT|nr:cyclic nucleotide-gated ion channel [Insolitispirillum peregrinum]SIT00570.1 voltage-gated potassium channel [Insolitispirillum peregrinum]
MAAGSSFSLLRRSWRTRLYSLLIDTERRNWWNTVFDGSMVLLLLLSTGAVIMESVPEIEQEYGLLIEWVDAITVIAISVEYGLRLWCCTDDPYYASLGRLRGRLAYALTPLSMLDLVALLPYYLALISAVDLRFLMVLRLLRILKLARYSPALSTVLAAVAAERKALTAALFLLLVSLVLVSGVMYHIEGDVQPDAFGTIPRAMWWAIVTLTTVGYGDVTPVTAAGRIFAALTALLGIMICAVPAGLMASSFIAELRKRDFVVSCRLVARVPFFRSLEAALIAEIAAALQPLVLPPNYVIVHKGDRGDRVYFIVEGEARVELPNSQVTLRAGEFFGETALLYDRPRQATVVTASECRLLHLDREPFLELLRAQPAIRDAVERVAEQRIGRPPDHADKQI